MTPRTRLILVVFLAAVYAACYSAIKAGLIYAPPLRFAGLRAVLGGAALLGLLAVLRKPLLPPRRLWPGIAALAVSGTLVSFGAMFLSPGRTGAGIASVLGNTGPLLVVILAAIFLEEPVTRAKAASLILGLAGVTLIAYPAITDPSRRGPLGAVLPLVAAAGTAVQSVIVKRLEIREALLPLTAWQFVLGGLPLLLVSAAAERGAAITWSGLFVSLLLFLTLVGTSAATALWFWLVQHTDVGRLTLQLFLVPVFGLILAMVLFRETIGTLEAAGIVIVVLGISLVARDASPYGPAARLSHGRGMTGSRAVPIEPIPCCTEHPGAECIPWPRGEADGYGLFFEGDDLYDAMVGSIGAARQRVDLETYIYAADEVGWRIAEALAARARAGVQVRVLVDAAGSLFSFSRDLEAHLRRHGVVVRRFHRWSWRRPRRFYRRNHRKLLAIDGREAYVGGFNIHRESSRSAYGPGRWRDTHLRLSGALAESATALFDAFWASDRSWSPRSARKPGDALVPNHSRICRHQVHCLYVRLLRSAETRLYLTTPYFVPDHRTQNELMRAASSGVDVRLLLPGKSDVPVTQWAARAAYGKLLSAGVRIFEYQPRVLHAKTAVVDGAVATVGTANLDYRSLFVNYELNLFSASQALCAALEGQFLADLACAEEVTAPRWSKRPWSGLVAESVGWMARRWL